MWLSYLKIKYISVLLRLVRTGEKAPVFYCAPLFLLPVCPAGRYGTQCLLQCQCENGATCDPVGGRCNCTKGWMGQICDQREYSSPHTCITCVYVIMRKEAIDSLLRHAIFPWHHSYITVTLQLHYSYITVTLQLHYSYITCCVIHHWYGWSRVIYFRAILLLLQRL